LNCPSVVSAVAAETETETETERVMDIIATTSTSRQNPTCEPYIHRRFGPELPVVCPVAQRLAVVVASLDQALRTMDTRKPACRQQ